MDRRRCERRVLVDDVDGNGSVDPGELFGSTMLLPDGTRATNGFQALAMYDEPAYGGNGDGLIGHDDAIWDRLRLWIDRNHDGLSQPREIESLGKEHIVSLTLNPLHLHRVEPNGNSLMLLKSFRIKAGGLGAKAIDVERPLGDIAFIPVR
jgi:hypothetical protein